MSNLWKKLIQTTQLMYQLWGRVWAKNQFLDLNKGSEKRRRMKFLLNWFYPLLAFFSIFIIRYFVVMRGIDLTDEGFALSNQLATYLMGIDSISMFPAWWLSDFIGGIWLKITENYGLWGARLGGILGSSLIVMYGLRMISFAYRPGIGLIITLLGSALYSHNARILYYSNVPALLFVMYGFSFLKLLENRSKTWLPIISGLLLIALILSKWTMGVTLFIPLCVWYVYRNYYKIELPFKPLYTMYGTAFITLALFLCFLKSQDLLKDFLVFSGPAKEHQFSSLIETWYRQLRTTVPLLILFFGIPSFYYSVSKRDTLSKTVSSLNIFLGLFLLSLFLSFFRSKWFCPFSDVPVVYILTYLICGMISTFCIFILRRSLSIQEFSLYLFSITLPFAQCACAGTGIPKAQEGMWLLGAVMLCLMIQVGKTSPFKTSKPQLMSICSLLIAMMSFYGIKYTYFYVNRDNSDLTQLTAEFATPRLKGIYTTPQRKESFEALIKTMGNYTKKGDTILAYFNLPMVYYISETLPLGKHPWLAVITPEKLQEKIDLFSSSEPPRVIVKSKTDPINPQWGLKPLNPFGYAETTPIDYQHILSMSKMMDQAVAELWDLKLVWSNPDFDLYTVSPKAISQ